MGDMWMGLPTDSGRKRHGILNRTTGDSYRCVPERGGRLDLPLAIRSAFTAGGFTLLEVLVAMAVLAVALVSLLGLYNRSLLLTIRAQHLSTATLLVQEMLTRTQLEGLDALRVTAGDFANLHPGQYPEFRWYRAVRPTALEGLWELHVGVSWGEREDETCELILFTPLS